MTQPTAVFPVFPVRVQKAIEIITMFDGRTRPTLVNVGDEPRVVEAKGLSQAEQCARDAAADCLASYFQGRLKADLWEAIAVQYGVPNHTLAAAPAELDDNADDEPPLEGAEFDCPTCPSDGPSAQCAICKGSGRVIVIPKAKKAA